MGEQYIVGSGRWESSRISSEVVHKVKKALDTLLYTTVYRCAPLQPVMYADIAIIQGIVEMCVWNIGGKGSIRGRRGI